MRGVQQLSADVGVLQAVMQDHGPSNLPFGDLCLLEGGNIVTFTFKPEEGSQPEPVRVTFSDVHKYPRTNLRVACKNPAVEATLSILGDSGDASVPLLLENLCDLYGLEAEQLFRSLPPPEEGGRSGDSASDNDNTDRGGSEDGGEDIDEDEGSDGQADMAEVEDRELTIAVANCTAPWERFEAEQARQGQEAGLSMEQGRAAEQQIFAPAEAFQILCKELRAIVRNAVMRKVDIAADAVGNNVYTWRVRISGFSPASQLGKDLAQLQQAHGYDFVELRVAFMRGLHPFYPPKVEVVRPRMPLAVVCALASHPLLSLEGWDPLKPCLELLKELRAFLEGYGSVELQSPLNSPGLFPLSAYTPVERQLVSLEGVSTEPPRAASMPEYADMYRARDQQLKADHAGSEPPAKRLKAEAQEKQCYWAAGTGYGTADATEYSNVWDRKSTLGAQAARDRQMECLLSKLASSLCCLLSEQPSGANPSGSGGEGGGDTKIREDTKMYSGAVSARSVWTAVCQSSVVPLLIRELSETSFNDMGTRCEYYMTCFRATEQLVKMYASQQQRSGGREGAAAGDGFGAPCIAAMKQAVDPLLEQAKFFLQVMQKGQTHKGIGPPSPQNLFGEAGPSHLEGGQGGADAEASEESMLELAQLIESVFNSMPALPQPLSGGQRGAGGSLPDSEEAYARSAGPREEGGGPSTSHPPDEESEVERYCRELRGAQVECADFSEEFQRHFYMPLMVSEYVPSSSRISKLGREIAALKSMLPLHPSSSIFVRVDEENSMLWRAMITGPDDTPYSCGCFIFDIFFPARYPDCPPKVNLQTTGGNSVRFNPNLYKDGKVCLSLLGTWDAHKSETWDPKVSSIVQVLVSIQSLIFVPDPFYNEPGYEKNMGKADGQRQSEAYNRNIRLATLQHAILGQLQKPPKEFAEVMRAHMRLRRPKVLALCEQWLAASAAGEAAAGEGAAAPPRLVSMGSSAQSAIQRMQTAVDAIKAKLEQL
mmetsp:Transcript_5781/g.16229  ORF Transcript_5781/g.16229 Transcript_5781/m.16229 type:complete len:994 (+) Transcript_5781:105-3086(+)|eukprot:CAMPEP_0117657236 /NCGR_PEP_ID=MMETSP0804-20121206/5223_1 /TAXON_ID=1074897 /ORGANISM="Tetraselmis astigmatica, Strain CCMP880" /LENGTH=993 /DNA_ID=CAMNT_0005463677 /DNA_START=407 /DNA_END=3388 /DNA_ORIENTATION=+